MSFALTVIIPVKNELKVKLLQEILNSFVGLENIEVLWISSKENDGTSDYLLAQKQKVFFVDTESRASRLNMGIRMASSDKILLHHPRSILLPEAIRELLSLWQKTPEAWGGFTHKFITNEHSLLNFTSFYSNEIRFDRSGIVYLDHCIFFPKKMMEDDTTIPEVDIFEDTLLSLKLRKHSFPVRLKSLSMTSPIRFEKNGVWRQAIMNQILKVGYKLRIPHKLMNKVYEKGLNLNSAYSDHF